MVWMEDFQEQHLQRHHLYIFFFANQSSPMQAQVCFSKSCQMTMQVLDMVWVQWQLLSTATAHRRARGILRLWYNESHQRRQGKALLGAWRVVVSLGVNKI